MRENFEMAQSGLGANEHCKTMPTYSMPADAEKFKNTWWRVADAAAAWGVSLSTAHRLIQKRPQECGRTFVRIVCPRGASARACVPCGTPKPKTKRGNPGWSRQKDAEVVK